MTSFGRFGDRTSPFESDPQFHAGWLLAAGRDQEVKIKGVRVV